MLGVALGHVRSPLAACAKLRRLLRHTRFKELFTSETLSLRCSGWPVTDDSVGSKAAYAAAAYHH